MVLPESVFNWSKLFSIGGSSSSVVGSGLFLGLSLRLGADRTPAELVAVEAVVAVVVLVVVVEKRRSVAVVFPTLVDSSFNRYASGLPEYSTPCTQCQHPKMLLDGRTYAAMCHLYVCHLSVTSVVWLNDTSCRKTILGCKLVQIRIPYNLAFHTDRGTDSTPNACGHTSADSGILVVTADGV